MTGHRNGGPLRTAPSGFTRTGVESLNLTSRRTSFVADVVARGRAARPSTRLLPRSSSTAEMRALDRSTDPRAVSEPEERL